MEVKVGQFEGPFDLLLQLIEREEMDITTVALAEVCEAYLGHLHEIEERSPEDVADFLVVAAKLLYLKSLALLPNADGAAVEDDTGLADQLRVYRVFAEAAKEIAAQFSVQPQMFGAVRMPIAAPQFIPPPRLTAAMLCDAIVRVIADIEPIVRIPKATIGRVIAIDDRIAEIRRLIAEQPTASFADILRGRTGRDEHIVSFLAILELVKREEVHVRQQERFSSITLTRALADAPSGR